uniref:helix-turn-helix transcriptional regulator n=1 Tax=Frankia sp. Cr1 TaxID=3073931 RepID=UPI002AD2948E
MGKTSQRVEQEELRARMRAVGMAHDEIAVEFARRYRLRPRAAHRVAHGWTQQQAAGHINAHIAHIGLDADGAASMSAPWLSELENWPFPARRRLTPRLLVVLAAVYGTDIHNLLDLDDREHLAPEDMLLINSMRRPAPPQSPTPA